MYAAVRGHSRRRHAFSVAGELDLWGRVVSTSVGEVRAGFVRLCAVSTDTLCFGFADHKDMDPKTSIHQLPSRACSKICQRGATLVGVACRMSHTCRTCACNAHNALVRRHGALQPPATGTFDAALTAFTSHRLALRGSYIYNYTYWGSADAWFTKWPQDKRRQFERSRLVDPVLPHRVKYTVKFECGQDVPSRPRGIQAYPNLATQEKFAREVYSMQKAFSDVFGFRGSLGEGVYLTFASGLNGDDLGRWMDDVLARGDVWFYERDGKNWDATMNRTGHELKLACYALTSVTRDCLDFIDSGYAVTGVHLSDQGRLKYSLVGTTKSGHNDTTLANSIINAAIAFEACVALGLESDILVCGDDLLVAVRGDFDHHALALAERSFGIIPVYAKFRDYRHVSFISGCWMRRSRGGFAFVPKPGRLLARLFWTVKPPSAKDLRAYVNGVVDGLANSCGSMPIIGAFLRAHRTGTVSIASKRYMNFATSSVVEVARDEFCSRYGLPLDSVEPTESLLGSLAGMVGLFSCPVLERILECDLCDVGVRADVVGW